jgi:ketosteroid isomerase-like protein
MSATTQQVLDHHLQCFGEGNLDGILEDYTAASLLFTPDGILRGPDEMRGLFEAFFAEFAKPGASFDMKKQIVEGETAYIVWSAETAREGRLEGVNRRRARMSREDSPLRKALADACFTG